MNYELTGEYACKMDGKGRIRIPSGLVDQLKKASSEFTINRGYDKHLILYPRDVWESKSMEINQLNIHNTKHRMVIRYFYRGATKLSLDSAERILIPKSLMEYAGFSKNVILFAYQQQIEIWSKDQYDKMLNEEPEDFASLADEIFGMTKPKLDAKDSL